MAKRGMTPSMYQGFTNGFNATTNGAGIAHNADYFAPAHTKQANVNRIRPHLMRLGNDLRKVNKSIYLLRGRLKAVRSVSKNRRTLSEQSYINQLATELEMLLTRQDKLRNLRDDKIAKLQYFS